VITLYVVMGSWGEYSDRAEWMVAAYADRALAEQHVLDVERELQLWLQHDWDWRETCARVNGDGNYASHPLDRVHGFNYSDYAQRYWLSQVELLTGVPQ